MRYNEFMRKPSVPLVFRIVLLTALSALAACNNNSSSDSTMGSWQVIFTGAYTGTAVMFVNSDGAFDFNVNLSDARRTVYAYRIQGVVGSFSKTIAGNIFQNQTEEVGQFSGIMRSSSACDGNWSIGSGAGFPQGLWTGQK
jgi:hypothetical protein